MATDGGLTMEAMSIESLLLSAILAPLEMSPSSDGLRSMRLLPARRKISSDGIPTVRFAETLAPGG
jgi:hypothetical protein